MDDNLRRKKPAQGRPRVRSHREEREARLDAVESWLAQRQPRAEIVSQCVKRWRVSTRQADRYIQAAAGRWRDRAEPEREENRRRNLATVDYGIAEACRLGKLHDLAVLVRLRARIDGSMDTALQIQPPAAEPAPDLSAELSLSVLCDVAVAVVDAVPKTPEVRHDIARLISALAPYVEMAPPSFSETQPCR